MKKIELLACYMLLLSFSCFAQQTDKKLERLVQKEIKEFKGEIGIYIKNLRTGKTVIINADTVFPTASIVKIPILLGVVNQISKGQLHYDSAIVYRDSLLYAGEDILGSFKDSERILLKKAMMLMLTTSDNTASLWLQKLSGGGTAINQLLDSMGFVATRVNSRTPGREEIRKIYGWGQTSPKEMGMLIEKIYRYEIFTPAACDRMMRCLGRNYWDENEAISQVPPYIEVFSKNGCVNATRNEILLVNAPHNPYIFSIFTKNNQDQGWTSSNEAWALTRKLSLLLWRYYEPNDKWEPKN